MNDERKTLPYDDDPDVRFLAEQTDLSPRQARELIARHRDDRGNDRGNERGNDRARLLEIARTMKAEG